MFFFSAVVNLSLYAVSPTRLHISDGGGGGQLPDPAFPNPCISIAQNCTLVFSCTATMSEK